MSGRHAAFFCLLALVLGSCGAEKPPESRTDAAAVATPRPEIYAEVTLTAELSELTEEQRQMIAVLIDVAKVMDDLFWKQAYGDDYAAWLASIDDQELRRFAALNYGPWDRMDADRPFIEGVGPKPLGANFYPRDMSKEEFEAAYLPGKNGRYSLIRRNETGRLVVIPYHVAYATELKTAAELLRAAADLADNADFATYLKLRATGLLSDEFQMSDLFWMDVKDNEIEVVVGPIETYEDRLYGHRAAYAAYVLIKDLDWSRRLGRYAEFLPELQERLPVPTEYKQERPGSDSDLNAYDVVYYAGYSNTGSKAIAINLPNDEEVQLQKGTRRLQLKNAMRAKFEKILQPIAAVLVEESQRQHVTFDAFFAKSMFHEVAHGLGIKSTITGNGTVREALRDMAASVEEGKADVLGLYMITELHKAGELGDVDLRDYYVTFMASIFRSIRFGASSAHGKANMLRFNFFAENGAFVRDPGTGRYRVDFPRMEEATMELARLLLMLQGDGDYAGAEELMNSKGVVGEQLQSDLDRLMRVNIPIDIAFNQGVAQLGIGMQ